MVDPARLRTWPRVLRDDEPDLPTSTRTRAAPGSPCPSPEKVAVSPSTATPVVAPPSSGLPAETSVETLPPRQRTRSRLPSLSTASSSASPGAGGTSAAQTQLTGQIAQALTATSWPTLSPTMDSVMTGGLGPDDIHACGRADTIDEAVCTFGDPKAKHTVVVVGNSVAMVYVDLLHKVLGDDHGWRVISYGMYGCGFRDMTILAPPADAQASCRQRPDDAVTAINRLDPDVVVLSGTGNVASADSEIAKLKVKSKLVLLPGPPADKDVNACYTKVSTPADCVSVPDETWGVLESKVASDVGGVYVNSLPWFCVDGKCPAFVGSTPMKLDRFHLTSAYNALITPVVRDQLTAQGIFKLSAA